MIFLLSFFWYARTVRALLFALYLWQLKEYHIKRFLAHFGTAKGKRLFLHPFVAAKLALLGLWLFWPGASTLLLLALYIGETALVLRALRVNTLLLPVLTRKTAVLICSVFLVQSLFLAGVLLYFSSSLFLSLILFDLLSLFIGTFVVLAWQPYTIFERKRILQQAGEKRKRMKNLKVIGITGSYGKTSTKEFLAHILGTKFVVLKTPEHKNSEMGIAHTILYDLTDEHQVFVCEMGAYSKGGIKLLSDMVQPAIGVVTGVNEQHLGVFGSEMNLISTEGGGELVRSLPQDGTLVLNDDSKRLHELGPWLQLWNPDFANYIWCSAKGRKDVFAKDVAAKKEEVSFTLAVEGGEEAKVILPLPGAHNVENAVLAAATARELGMSIEETAKALTDTPKEASAMQLEKGKSGFDILNSSYSANPTGVLAALEHLSLWEGKKIVVMPSLIELGPASRKVHTAIGQKIGEICDMALITTKDEFPALLSGAKERGMKEENIMFLEDSQKIAEKILAIAKKGDGVLLEGRVPAEILSLLKA